MAVCDMWLCWRGRKEMSLMAIRVSEPVTSKSGGGGGADGLEKGTGTITGAS